MFTDSPEASCKALRSRAKKLNPTTHPKPPNLMRKQLFRSAACCLFILAAGVGTSLMAQVSSFTGQNVGAPTISGNATNNPDGTTTVTGGGNDIWNTSDNCFYYYTTVTGLVWDAQMRVVSFDGPDQWSKVELMVRRPDPTVGTPQGGDPQMDVCSTRVAGIDDMEFQYRGTRGAASGNAVANGLLPNYPNEWLRITRTNTIFYLFYSTTGTNWTFVNSQDTSTTANGFDGTAWENPIELGVAVTAHNDTSTNLGIAVVSNLTVAVTTVVPPTSAGVVTQINGTTNVYTYTEASFNFVATNNATPLGVYGMQYAWYKNGVLVSTNPMGPNFTFLTSPADNSAQIYAVASVANTNYSSVTVTSAVMTLATQPGAVTYTNGLKREMFANADRGQVEDGSVARAGIITMVSAADVNISGFNGSVNYTERFSGYFIPPTNGAYVFFINSDDDSDLFLSTDNTAAHKQLIAQETVYSNPYDWLTSDAPTGIPTQKRSDQFSPDGGTTIPYANGINLVGGQYYYIEAVHHQAGGGANMAVTYQTTNQIGAANWSTVFTNGTLPLLNATNNNNIALITWPGTNIAWSVQPKANVTVFEGGNTNFFAMATSDSEMTVNYQWFVNGAPYTGANGPNVTNLQISTIPASYNGAQVYVVASTAEGGLAITSSVATLTVQQAVFEVGFLKDERWGNQTSVLNLENGSLGTPDFTMAVPMFAVGADNPNSPQNFVRHVSGYFVPPTSVNYTFYTTSDDDSDLFISTDNTPIHKRLVCHQADWNNGANWPWVTANGGGNAALTRSTTWTPDGVTFPWANGIPLVAAQRYYIEQDHHQGGGGANNSATYVVFGQPDPLAGKPPAFQGSVIGMNAVRCTYVAFTQQPTNVTTMPMGSATFAAPGTTDSQTPIGTSFGNEETQTNNFLFYRWYKNGVLIPGANSSSLTLGPLMPGDNGATIYCQMRALGFADNSLNPIWSNSLTATITIASQAVFEPGLLREDWWTNITSRPVVENGSVGNPRFTYTTPIFEGPSGIGNGNGPTIDYVNRISGFFVPQTNGLYTFFTDSDDDSDLFISTDATPGNKRLVAQEAGWSGVRNWVSAGGGGSTTAQKRSDQWTDPTTATQPYSTGISLNGGQAYYIEQVHHNGAAGGTHATATYKAFTDPDPVDGDLTRMVSNLIGMYVQRIPWVAFLQQPTSQTNLSGGYPVTFGVAGTNAPEALIAGTTDNPLTFINGPGVSPLQYQWYKNGVAIPGATAATYTQPFVLPSDQGAQFVCGMRAPGYADNSLNRIWSNSVPAVLTVITDTVPPTLSAAITFVNSNWPTPLIIVDVTFSKWMDPTTLSNIANYSIAGTTITNLNVASNHRTVELDLSSMPTLPLTITVNGAKDLSGNALAANSSTSINTDRLTFSDVGAPNTDPAYPSYIWIEGNGGYLVSAEGSDIWNTADGCDFGWEMKTNDFDVVVRGVRDGHTSNFAKMGLMVRESLDPASRDWNIINDPAAADGIMAPDNSGFGQNQVECNARTTYAAASAGWDTLVPRTNAPAYPNAWVRLKRTGNVLTAFLSTNGTSWLQLAYQDTSTNVNGALTNVAFVGICTTAHNNDALGGPPPPPFLYYNTAEYANYNSSFVQVQATQLTIGVSGHNVTISWTPAGGHLMSSPALSGPGVNWQTVGTSNPATVPIGSGTQFFRVVVP